MGGDPDFDLLRAESLVLTGSKRLDFVQVHCGLRLIDWRRKINGGNCDFVAIQHILIGVVPEAGES
jgi:hypothetical protein